MASSESSAPPALPLCLLVIVASAAATIYFWTQGDHVAAAALVAVMIAAMSGYCVGALKFAGFFGGLYLAYQHAPQWAEPCEAYLADLWGRGEWNHWIAVGACGLGVLLAAMLAARFVAWVILPSQPWLQGCNRWLGFSFGAAQGVGLTLLFLSGLQIVEPEIRGQRYEDASLQQAVAERVLDVVEQTRESMIGPWVAAANPFEHVDQLRDVQDLIRGWCDPDVRRRYQRSAFDRLSSDASLRNSLERLAADPAVRSRVESLADNGKLHPANASMVQEMLGPDLWNTLTKSLGMSD